MLDAERKLVDALGASRPRAQPIPNCRKPLSRTRRKLKNRCSASQIFEQLGEQPEDAECKGVKGLLEEVESFKEEDPSEDILDVFNIGAAIKVESYETNSYESLIRLATEMEHTKAVKLLQQNLKEEQATWKKLDAMARKIKPNRTGHEDAGAEGEGEAEAQPRRRGGKAA